MSIVVYHKGQLAADRRALQSARTYLENLAVMQKIHVSPCKRIALGYCGDKLEQATIDGHLEWLLLRLISGEVNKDHSVLKIKAEDWLEGADTSMIIMTASNAYLYSRRVECLIDITDTHHAIGNGAAMAFVCIAAGLTPKDTIVSVSEISNQCGEGVNHISQKELKPLVEVAVKPKTKPRSGRNAGSAKAAQGKV